MSEPRWLDDEEQRTWRSFITASRLFWDRVERQLQQRAGIPHAYYEILVRLSEAPDRTLRMSQLASNSLSSRSRLSHAVARMEESGWIRRLPFADDRRGALAQLTDEGMARLEAAAPGSRRGGALAAVRRAHARAGRGAARDQRRSQRAPLGHPAVAGGSGRVGLRRTDLVSGEPCSSTAATTGRSRPARRSRPASPRAAGRRTPWCGWAAARSARARRGTARTPRSSAGSAHGRSGTPGT